MNMNIRLDIRDALGGLQRAGGVVLDGVESYGKTAAASMERYAKANRPWTDRTGNARRTLEGRCERGSGGRTYTVGIVGHMPYSVYLELAHGQKYAVLYPTVNALSAEILRGWADTVSRLK